MHPEHEDISSSSSDLKNKNNCDAEFDISKGESLGKGAFGLVYECTSKFKEDKNKYAIKFIKCQTG